VHEKPYQSVSVWTLLGKEPVREDANLYGELIERGKAVRVTFCRKPKDRHKELTIPVFEGLVSTVVRSEDGAMVVTYRRAKNE
jgi:hypothetical protein